MKEGATATDRWSHDDLRGRLDGAPTFRITDRVDDDTLARICAAHTTITGDPVRTERPWKKNLIAAAYRVHGDDFLPFVADLFEANGTAMNLLGILRSSAPRNLAGVPADAPQGDDAPRGATSMPQESGEGPAFEGWPAFWAPDEDADDGSSSEPLAPVQVAGDDLLPGLLYGESGCPPFDPTSKRRWDDRASNPDRDAILAERARRMANAGGSAA